MCMIKISMGEKQGQGDTFKLTQLQTISAFIHTPEVALEKIS